MNPLYRISINVDGPLREGDMLTVNTPRGVVPAAVADAVSLATVVKGGTELVELEIEGIGTVEGTLRGVSASRTANPDATVLAARSMSPLATRDRSAVLAYLRRMEGSRGYEAPAVLLVTSSGPDGVKGCLIGEEERRRFGEREDVEDVTVGDVAEDDPVSAELAVTWDARAGITREFPVVFNGQDPKQLLGSPQPAPSVSEGDILAASNFGFEIEDGVARVRLVDVAIIGNAPDVESAVGFLGLRETPPRHTHPFYFGPSGGSTFHRNYEIAVSRTEPDEALVLFFGEGRRRDAYVLGQSGYEAFVNDDLVSYLESHDLEPGLWVIENLRNHSWQSHEGEWDAGVEGDWRPANTADVERLFGPADNLDAEIADVMETDPEAGLGERFMAMAVQAAFDEKFNHEHAGFVRHRFGVLDKEYSLNGADIDCVNPASVDEYVGNAVAAIDDPTLRGQVARLLRKAVFERTSLFQPVDPTPAEREVLGSVKTWRKDRVPRVFVPTEALESDVRAIVSAVRRHARELLVQVGRGADFSRTSPSTLMGGLVRPLPLSPDDFPLFSQARRLDGEWRLVGVEGRTATLALFVKGRGEARNYHAATLRTTGERSELLSPHGLRVTTPSLYLPVAKTFVSVPDLLLDADRAVCELETRREVKGDILKQVADGVHRDGRTTIHVADGVMHRDDGPALERLPGERGGHHYAEYRFRGNLHRDRGPAQTVNGEGVWFRHGLEHRTDGPSTEIGPEVEYRRHDVLHRDDGPAVNNGGYTCWYRNGVKHRDDGPAETHAEGVEYYRGGLLHRTDGPAAIYADGTEVFSVNGREVEAEELAEAVSASPASAPAP